MVYASREDAGRKLARYLGQHYGHADIVLGLPRGGVIVAAEIAHIMQLPLDVLLVRKIGHPRHREFALGALAEPDVVVLHEDSIAQTGANPNELNEVIAEERERLREYREMFLRGQPPDLVGKNVLLVDDGLATGATMQAAVQSSKQRHAGQVMVAVPVASDRAVELLQQEADVVYAMLADPQFEAVGHYYGAFSQTTDQEVLEALLVNRRDYQLH